MNGKFGADGEAAQQILYNATVESSSSEEEVLQHMRHTNSVAEIQNTVRKPIPVLLARIEARQPGKY